METSFNLKHTIDQIVKEKGIDKSIVLDGDLDEFMERYLSEFND